MEDFPAAPIIRGNSLYTIVDGPSWKEAQQHSASYGGHLAVISSAAENNIVLSLAQQVGNEVHIGYTDEVNEGLWVWVKDEGTTFENWGPQDPNNSWNGAGEDFAILRPYGGTYGSGGNFDSFEEGSWNDISNSNTVWDAGNRVGVAEIPFIRRGDSAYVIVEAPTWEEAEANAVALGGHLVTINDAEENEWLHLAFEIAGDDHSQFLWTGLSDTASEGDWEWSSGEPVSYLNWGINEGLSEPNGGIGSPYMHLGRYPLMWNDAPNNQGGIAGGIAEIPLAPNNTPTGTPEITGDFKVGQTISIDASAIDDADNFEGWTASYEYSWEVSGDNGSTWTELTSADATDGDDSYTLTSEEVGKQLRGVVSYLDGYGTNEVIESNISPSIESSVEVILVGPPNVGQSLDLDIEFTDDEVLPIRWLGWQAKAPDSAIAIKASDLHMRSILLMVLSAFL